MSAGTFTVSLHAETPLAIVRDVIDQYGHIFTFDSSKVRAGLSDTTMQSLARWGGVVRLKSGGSSGVTVNPWNITGANMIVWLGDEDGKGPLLETAVTKAASTFATWMGSILPASVTSGTITAGGTTVANTYGGLAAGKTPVSPRQAIDNLASICGFEYRVTKSVVFDADLVGGTGLFKQTPVAVVMRRSSGRDQNVIGISTTELDLSVDSEEYVTRVLIQDAGGTWTGASGSATPYKDLLGNLIVMTKPVPSPMTPNANAATQAANLVAAGQVLRNAITLTSDEFDIDRDIVVGDYIYVYDQPLNLVDTTNPLRYRGNILYPMKVRVLAINWPIERGMSVWYRDKAAVWTDLTDYVEFEPAGVTLEVDAPTRPLTKFVNTKT